jgi:hypothetical protein
MPKLLKILRHGPIRLLFTAKWPCLDTVPATSKPLIDEAKAAHKKASELDNAGENKANLENANGTIFSQYELNQGVKAYQTSNFSDAYTAFQ